MTEEEKDLIVLNNYTGNRVTVSPKNDMTETLDRVTVTCSFSHIHLIACDMSDLYDDAHYVLSHQLKVIQDFDIKVLVFGIPKF